MACGKVFVTVFLFVAIQCVTISHATFSMEQLVGERDQCYEPLNTNDTEMLPFVYCFLSNETDGSKPNYPKILECLSQLDENLVDKAKRVITCMMKRAGAINEDGCLDEESMKKSAEDYFEEHKAELNAEADYEQEKKITMDCIAETNKNYQCPCNVNEGEMMCDCLGWDFFMCGMRKKAECTEPAV